MGAWIPNAFGIRMVQSRSVLVPTIQKPNFGSPRLFYMNIIFIFINQNKGHLMPLHWKRQFWDHNSKMKEGILLHSGIWTMVPWNPEPDCYQWATLTKLSQYSDAHCYSTVWIPKKLPLKSHCKTWALCIGSKSKGMDHGQDPWRAWVCPPFN